MKFLNFIAFTLMMCPVVPLVAEEFSLPAAIQNIRENCVGISDELNHMKMMAGINTAVTGVGTLAGGGAVAVGFIKASKDKKSEEYDELIAQLNAAGAIEITDEAMFYDKFSDFLMETGDPESIALAQSLKKRKSELDMQSKNLGNWRTGLLAGNTATNVAGAVIAGTNKVKGDLNTQIGDCRAAVDTLRHAELQAHMDNTADADMFDTADQIISACGKWETTDVSKINNRATGAMWSSIAGATAGGAGTVTSVLANTDKTRNDNTDSGRAKEKNLNTASNVLAIGATAASTTATVFNAMQVAAIKKASDVSDNCEKALR
ncbi:MAG: hypothetical protein FWC51_00805 [Proteobacteria bacterium]|nr:hypothetical protein [Pseudomonadota bacterium]